MAPEPGSVQLLPGLVDRRDALLLRRLLLDVHENGVDTAIRTRPPADQHGGPGTGFRLVAQLDVLGARRLSDAFAGVSDPPQLSIAGEILPSGGHPQHLAVLAD